MEWPLLHVLPPEVRAAVVVAAHRRRYDKGEVVFNEGDTGDAVHLVQIGRFAVRVNNEGGDVATLRILRPGDAFGELSLVHDVPASRSATVLALEAAETLSLSGRSFTSLRRHHPDIDRLLVHLLAERVEQLSDRLLEALFLGADRRIYRRLVELVAVYTDRSPCPPIPLTQDDLAGMAGTTRPTVNQVLRRLAAEGTVTLRRGTITVQDLDRLRERAQ